MSEKPGFEEPEQKVAALEERAEDDRKQTEKGLSNALKEWQTTFNAINAAIWVIDKNSRIQRTNRTAEQMFHLSEKEIVGKHCWKIVHNTDHPIPECPMIRAKESLHRESMTLKSDGKSFNVTADPVVDENGEYVKAVHIVTDITERTSTEERLERSETILNETQQLTKIGGWQWDIKLQQMYWTDELYRLHGLDPAQFRPGSPEHIEASLDCYDEDDQPIIREAFWKCAEEGDAYNLDFPFTKATGERIWIRTAAKPVYRNGQVEKVIGNLMDITDQKLAEDRALAQSERLRIFFSSVNDAIFVHPLKEDGFAPFVEVNNIACERYGYSYEEFLKLAAPDITSKPDADHHGTRNHRRNLLATGHQVFEAVHIKKSGERFPVEINSNIVYQHGTPYILAVVRDITDRKQAEEEQEKLQDQLNQAQKMESVGRLAGGVAHDFNNMLGVILGNTELALTEVDMYHPLHEYLKEIKKAAQRSADVTRQLLAFARKQTISPKVLDLNETVVGMLKMLQRLIGEDIDLIWLPGNKLWLVRMDPSQIDQILANLCVNARDAIVNTGKLTIETGNVTFDEAYCADHPGFFSGDFVLLMVNDDGCGMDKETLNNLFEPFYTTKDKEKGTGLGLATVYGIVKQNNGFINVYSVPEQGTTFKIYLPRYENAGEQVLQEKPLSAHAQGSETIILVEDEPAILSMTTIMLERLGYTVLTAATPGEAIRAAREHAGTIHLLMTDVVMPEMNGRELFGNLLSIYPNLKCLFMSGYTANVIAHRGVLEESVYFIQKPFSMWNLSVKVREVLDKVKDVTC